MIYLNTSTFPKMPFHVEELYLYERNKYALLGEDEEEQVKKQTI
jgi:hypothetical protein